MRYTVCDMHNICVQYDELFDIYHRTIDRTSRLSAFGLP
jgi:hypothetical protein